MQSAPPPSHQPCCPDPLALLLWQVMFHCTKSYGVRLHVFSPRHLNSYCFKPCGCDYAEADISTQAGGRTGRANCWWMGQRPAVAKKWCVGLDLLAGGL